MKHLFIALSLLFFALSCTRTHNPPGPAIPRTEAEIAKQGEEEAMKLLKALKKELTGTIEKKGPLGAVEFCSLQALPLTAKIQAQMEKGIELKRTSLKVRNPQNAPDDLEKEALEYFAAQIQKGKMPSFYLQKEKNNKGYRYYKPMKIEGLCLACHGNPEQMEKELVTLLKKKYPQDQSLGYKVDDFRGLVRVSLPR